MTSNRDFWATLGIPDNRKNHFLKATAWQSVVPEGVPPDKNGEESRPTKAGKRV
jgi:hypothetical protein